MPRCVRTTVLVAALAIVFGIEARSQFLAPARQLRLFTPRQFPAGLPFLVRVEVTDASGCRDWTVWDGDAFLTADPPQVVLSTNRVQLRNGLGTALVRASHGDFTLRVEFQSLSALRSIEDFVAPPHFIGGALPGASTSWSGLIVITNDVIVPFGHTLTLQSNTVVLVRGTTNGNVANDISVNGSLMVLGTEEDPVTITCAETNPLSRWGQIRHNHALPSVYQHATIARGGRGTVEGHTATAPMMRIVGSQVRFESCNITDAAETDPAVPGFGRPGKILQSSLGSDLVFSNCVLSRARMGPELNASALLLVDSYITDMRGTNDSDGLFLDPPDAGQRIRISRTVIAGGDDDGIDTLLADFTIEDSIVRDWSNRFEDSKGISLDGGHATVRHCLLVNNAIGISAKGSNNVALRLTVDQSTVLSQSYAIGVTNKNGTSPFVDVRMTNSVLRGASDSLFTQYNPADIRLFYCNVGEFWPGVNCSYGDPLFTAPGQHDYSPRSGSPLIDAGDPIAVFDRDGTRRDVGYFPFLARAELGPLVMDPDGSVEISVSAAASRSYAIETSGDLIAWTQRTTWLQTNEVTVIRDEPSQGTNQGFYRVKLLLQP